MNREVSFGRLALCISPAYTYCPEIMLYVVSIWSLLHVDATSAQCKAMTNSNNNNVSTMFVASP